MSKFLSGFLVSVSLLNGIPNTIEYTAEPVEEIIHLDEQKPEDIPSLVDYYADKYGVSKDVMHTVVNCESGYKPQAVGDSGQSFGLVQIHMPSWGGAITPEQANDPDFALNFLAEKLSEGRGYLWTCYRMHYA